MNFETNLRLDGQAAVVTGASTGLGAIIARSLAANGCAVVLAARRESLLNIVRDQIVADGGRAVTHVCDVADPDHADHLVRICTDEYGRLDGIVANAGIADGGPAEAMTSETYERVLRVNVTASGLLAGAAAAHMIGRASRGWVILMGSILARRGGTGGGVAAYAASKAAVEHLTRELARQWAPNDIRVNALSPGYFPTDMNAPMMAKPGRQEEIISRIPMGRCGDPIDLAGAVTFLASDASRYITGHILTVDGGMDVW